MRVGAGGGSDAVYVYSALSIGASGLMGLVGWMLISVGWVLFDECGVVVEVSGVVIGVTADKEKGMWGGISGSGVMWMEVSFFGYFDGDLGIRGLVMSG